MQTKSRHIQFYLQWCSSIIKTHSSTLLAAGSIGSGMAYQESLRSLIRAVSTHEKEIMTACDFNQFQLCFLSQSGVRKTDSSESLISESTQIDAQDNRTTAAETISAGSTLTTISKRSRIASNKSSSDGAEKQVQEKKRKIKS
jgi:hypothetical protein